MRIASHVETINHPLGRVQIRAKGKTKTKKLKTVVKKALDKYENEAFIPASVIHEMVKAEQGDYYHTPGYMLRLYRTRVDFTQKKLASKLHIKQHHISEMENNKRPIGKDMAKKIAAALEVDGFSMDYRELL